MYTTVNSDEKDPFINKIQGLNGISFSSEQFTNGYRIQPFLQPNRNHFDDRPEGTTIKSLVMHFTVSNFYRTLDLFTNNISNGRVSSHYVITENEPDLDIPGGKVVQVIPEEKRAWHAGVSQWREIVSLNGVSIGIENVNKGFTKSTNQWYPFDVDQIHSLGILSQGIVKKYNILPIYIVGHADIAPNRKQDPGILFPWGLLYKDYGVGAWLLEEERDVGVVAQYCPKEPLPQGVSISFLSTYLKYYGYNIEPTGSPNPQFSSVLKAFKSHFAQNQNPNGYNDIPDLNDMFWIWGLTAKYLGSK